MSNINFGTLVRDYMRLAAAIAEYHDDSCIQFNIASSLIHGRVTMPLGILVKSHKSAGAQSLRTVHRGLMPCFDGLSAWLCAVLRPLELNIVWFVQISLRARERLL